MLRIAIGFFGPLLTAAAPLIIRDVTVIDLRVGRAIQHQTVHVENGRIAYVGDDRTLTLIPRDAIVLDARGKYLMPGLIGALDRPPHQLVALGVTAVRHRGPIPEDEHAEPRIIDADPAPVRVIANTRKDRNTSAFRRLRSITIDAVAGTNFEGQLGLVAPGYLADLLLLTANPLDDANHLLVAAVILNGHVLDRRELDELIAVH